MNHAHKIIAVLGAIAFQVSRIETVREQLRMSGPNAASLAGSHDLELAGALLSLDGVLTDLAEYMNGQDMADENDVAILSPVFDLMKDYPYEDE